MDFKPFSKVVLPPEKGTGIKKGNSDLEKTTPLPNLQLPKPREFHFFSEPIMVLDQPAPETEKTKKTAPPPALPTEEAPEPSMKSEPAVKQVNEEKGGISPGSLLGSSQVARRPMKTESNAPQDFIIAYDGRLIGHYRSGRRVTNRTAFQNVARQLGAEILGFDIAKLDLFKLVAVRVEKPQTLGELNPDSYRWFVRNETSELVPSL